jgi:hypothetical protein
MDLDLAVGARLAIQQPLARDALPDGGDETRLVPAPVRLG